MERKISKTIAADSLVYENIYKKKKKKKKKTFGCSVAKHRTRSAKI